ncbi:MAG TPA: CDP-alcohol phosphatidyltransferase family protein [Gemmatimonadales bacterium]|nr:CDP-alcohol phosphatidyltransferase family protein [Gemmatimonadales bacterium]
MTDSGVVEARAGTAGAARRRRWWAPADAFTVARIPLALAFVAVSSLAWRTAILGVAAASDFADGYVARRWGGSRLGAFLDPVADKLFAACGFGVVLAARALSPLEVVGVLARDFAAAFAFLATVIHRRPAAIPARLGGKAVTIGQLLTLFAFCAGSAFLRPLAWATAAVGLYAIWDYQRVAPSEKRGIGE